MNQRENILNEAKKLFWAKGYDRTGVRNICKACGFRQSNLYNYFSTKEEILYEIISNELKRLIANIEHLEHDIKTNPIEQLKLFIENHVYHEVGPGREERLTFETEMRHMSEPYRGEIIELRKTYDRILGRIIQRGIDTGVFAQVDETVANYAISSIIVRTRLWYSPTGRLSPKELSDKIFEFVLNGLKVSN